MVRILIVDDDPHIRELICLFLQNEGFEMMEAENGEDALALVVGGAIQMVILDIMMPLMDGWELCREIRKRDNNLPLLMVTAKGEAEDKVKGFKLGSDDYLTKPFHPMELVMRVKALLKRSRIALSQTIQLGDLVLDGRNYKVICDGVEAAIPLKEFELLFKLASHPGQIFTRQALIDQIWGMDYEGDDRTVDVHIKRLRQRFAEYARYFHIETARSIGYRLVMNTP